MQTDKIYCVTKATQSVQPLLQLMSELGWEVHIVFFAATSSSWGLFESQVSGMRGQAHGRHPEAQILAET